MLAILWHAATGQPFNFTLKLCLLSGHSVASCYLGWPEGHAHLVSHYRSPVQSLIFFRAPFINFRQMNNKTTEIVALSRVDLLFTSLGIPRSAMPQLWLPQMSWLKPTSCDSQRWPIISALLADTARGHKLTVVTCVKWISSGHSCVLLRFRPVASSSFLGHIRQHFEEIMQPSNEMKISRAPAHNEEVMIEILLCTDRSSSFKSKQCALRCSHWLNTNRF